MVPTRLIPRRDGKCVSTVAFTKSGTPGLRNQDELSTFHVLRDETDVYNISATYSDKTFSFIAGLSSEITDS